MSEQLLSYLFEQRYAKVALEDGKLVGYLTFDGPFDGYYGNVKGAFSPLGGSAFYGTRRDMTASLLLEAIMGEMIQDGVFSVDISRFAQDEQMSQFLVLEGFGIRCSDAIMELSKRKVEYTEDASIKINEEHDQGKSIASLKYEMAAHMARPLISLPTNLNHYIDQPLSDEIRIFVAKAGDRPIGFLLLSEEGENYLTQQECMSNICGMYVTPEYRNKIVAKKLLAYACDECEKSGMRYLGVDCETMNPTALRFWRKFFTNYTYNYVRRIDERIQGYHEYLKEEQKKSSVK